MPDHPFLEDRHRRGSVLRLAPQRRVLGGHDEAAASGECRLMHPALGAFGVLHQSPDLELA